MDFNAAAARNAPTACEGILTAVGMSGSVILGVAIDQPALSPFAAFGAMIAMRISPRHGAKARIIGAVAGCLFLLLAASLSQLIAGYQLLALLLLFVLSWLAALPRKDLAYLGFVTRCATVAVLLSYFDFTPSLAMAFYFSGGILLGIFLSIANMAFEKEDQQSPLDQLRALLHGDINNPWLSLVIPITVVISSMLARIYSYTNPAWVGLTVIFVASSSTTSEWKRLVARIAGTMAGVFLSYSILYFVHPPLQLALIVGCLAFFLPFSGNYYSVFSLLLTCIVLILIDISMLAQGGDMRLLFWRGMDTILGCLCVMVAHLALRSICWLKKSRSAPDQAE